ncbi:cytochrome b561 and DOMON domain-containing protein At5g47530-like [Phalaenopsis equestris]|uniref:cytochrome b561 and DOMON domain-containing protein At5g47530-like n=1 Tax=Phalaenopsis equestris TaxID=78828 RepID=UPI0009E47CFD|nr:cytochrome b561 and DOMON domain-containing protein At5g47530-like [Phalaenopsis equestris]
MQIQSTSLPLLLLLFLSLSPLSSSQQSCTSDTFSQNRLFSLCNSLPVLSSTLHWTYHPANSTVDVAYRAPQKSDGWIAWALNPTGSGMDGAQTIFAFHDSRNVMTTVSSPITLSNPVVKNSSLSFKVYRMGSEFSSNMMTIYATIQLPGNRTRVNHVWQASNTFSNGLPSGHPTTGPNVQSTATLDFLSGQSSAAAGSSRLHRKNTHGVLNAVSWGILMPIGAIIARYMRVFKSADPAWFYLHVACQCSAYVVGVAGWGTGLKLGSDSKGITYHSHRNIGITLFTLATLQVFALLLRPKKDHKYRLYWNIYHHAVGYTVIVLSIVNIFKGFDILDPDEKWKHAYIGIIASLGGIAVILEVFTWGVVLKRKRAGGSDKSHNGVNGVNGTNGYGARQHQGV